MHEQRELLQRRAVHPGHLRVPHHVMPMKGKSTMTNRYSTTLTACVALALFACGSSGTGKTNRSVIDRSDLPDGSAGSSGASSDGGGSGGSGGGSNNNGGQGSVMFGFLDGGRTQMRDSSCGASKISAAPPNVNILLVIDESGSMDTTPMGASDDKWTSMKTALGAALDGTKDRIAYGLELFPAPADPKMPIPVGCTDNCCEMPALPGITVPVEGGATGVPKIVSALGAAAPGGGTPTAEALRRAADYFTKGAGSTLKGDRYVLLATDGGPDCNSALSCDATTCTTNLDGQCSAAAGNCCDPKYGGAAALSRCLDDSATTAQIKALNTAGVKTFVVGIPGSEAYATALDAFAVAGGAPTSGAHKYFAVAASGGTAALTSALETITKGVITTCRLVLGSTPPDLGKLNVKVDGTVIPQSGPDGWSVDTSTSPPAVVLKGATCSDIETNGAQMVEIEYGCPTIVTR
jgi:hypothetical protein